MTTTSVHRQAGAREGAILLLASSLTIMGSVMVAPVLPRMIEAFAPVNPQASLWVPLAITGPALAIALFAPLAGWLADRFGRKRMLMLATLCYALLGALPALLAGYLLIGIGMVMSFVVPVQAPVLLVGLGVTSTTLIGLATGTGLLASLAGALMWPLVRRTLGVRGCNALLLLLGAGGLTGLVLAQSYATMLISIVVHGIGVGMLVPNAMAPVMNALSPTSRGRGMGFFTAFLYLGQFISPLVVGLAASQAGGLTNGILALAGLLTLYAAVWGLGALFRHSDARSATDSTSHLLSQEHHHEP